jgi:hypothetical protein
MAQLDTGAAWSVVDPETAAQVGVPGEGTPIRLRTAFGEQRGRLTRTPITFLADEGDEIEVDATVFVPDPDEPWPVGALFLGYGGLLERARFALDPPANEFHFGEA